jgi:hypothetical protein
MIRAPYYTQSTLGIMPLQPASSSDFLEEVDRKGERTLSVLDRIMRKWMNL